MWRLNQSRPDNSGLHRNGGITLNNYENLKSRIKSKDFASQSDARYAISKAMVEGKLTNEEHVELRQLVIERYKD